MNNEFRIETDELTGLYTRQTFYHLAKELIASDPDASYNVILSDIENFKMINVRYGEETGDELLRYIGKCLSMANNENMFYARYSGDQFVCIVKQFDNSDIDHQAILMEHIDSIYKNAPVSHFESKFGIYENVDKTLPISRMCDKALLALRTIKHQYGKFSAVYDQNMHQRYIKEQHIQESMIEALEQKQFKVYYQPKHNAKTGELIGAEALIRWTHPEYGFMSPADFIPLFEKNGFISSIDMFVLETVCQELSDWQNQSIETVPISVNASRKDILHENFLNGLERALKDSGVPSNKLHMEITETVFIEDVNLLLPIIQQIRDRGIKIELDDFGSGFSSLSLLTSLPLDVIKLDMSFVRDIQRQKMIVENIVKICHGLNCQMIAEGVEEEEQLEILRDIDCDSIQGYYFSKPLPSEDFRKYLMCHTTK